MRRILVAALVVASWDAPEPPARAETEAPGVAAQATIEWGLVLHGGAGTISREDMTAEREAEYRSKLTEALTAGHGVLEEGGSALDAVVAAINVLEDSPLFNAGKGAVFTADGTHSLDASIMDGATLRAGAVAGVGAVKNPIILARRVMEESDHVFLSGAGAEAFAREQSVEMVEPAYFYTEHRWQQLQEAQAEDVLGTVGVVALDRSGNLAVGTSTGGTTNKRWGRIGDSPVIGAGTYAEAACGVSGTGWGEYFIRNVVAHDICARVRYQGVTLAAAAHAVIMERLEAQEPETGGIIALDGAGHVVATFNTPGMYRGWIGADGEAVTGIYR